MRASDAEVDGPCAGFSWQRIVRGGSDRLMTHAAISISLNPDPIDAPQQTGKYRLLCRAFGKAG